MDIICELLVGSRALTEGGLTVGGFGAGQLGASDARALQFHAQPQAFQRTLSYLVPPLLPPTLVLELGRVH